MVPKPVLDAPIVEGLPTMATGISKLAKVISSPVANARAACREAGPFIPAVANPELIEAKAGGALNEATPVPTPTPGWVVLISI